MYRALRATAGYVGAVYLLLALLIAASGSIAPHPSDNAELRALGAKGTVVLVGLAATNTRDTRGSAGFQHKRYYAVFPGSVLERVLWVVTERGTGGPASVRRSSAAFWGVLTALLASLLAVCWHWLIRRPRQPRDHSSKPTPRRGTD